MAAKKETTTTVEEKKVEVHEAPKTVRVMLPRFPNGDNPDVYVSINEKDWLIKRGVWVEVPVGVAEVLRHREEMLEVGESYKDELEKTRKSKASL